MKNALTAVRDIATGEPVLPAEDTNFAKTVGASLAFKYSPLIDRVRSDLSFPSLPEDGYRARDHIPDDLKEYGSHFLQATNQEHMDFLVTKFRENQQRRQYLSQTSFLSQLAAEVVDPVNLIAIPFATGARLSSVALRSGAATGAVVAGQEAVRYPFDPLATGGEVAASVGSAAVLGGMIGSAVSVPRIRRNQAIQRGAEEIEKLKQAIEPIEGAEIDPKIADSWFTDSPLFNMVSTPMKRTLQDPEINNQTKLTMLEIANDAGILLNANRNGVALNHSVFQNAKLYEGEWVKSYDDLLNTWGESTGRGVTNPMDYLIGRQDFETWLEIVDRKVIKGEKAADTFEAKAMDTLNSFYSTWEGRLRERGLIGSADFYRRDIKRRRETNERIQAEIKDLVTRPEYARLRETIDRNERIIAEHEETLVGLKEDTVMPPFEEVFRPRYWDKDSINNDRAGFSKILSQWFAENPTGYVQDKMGKWSKVEYDSTPDAIAKRVDEAIDTILGMTDTLDLDNAAFGAGKSKHFKHRALDIPNRLVLDYMHTNPVSVMKAYTARTAPRYQFSVQFGERTIDDVLDEEYFRMIQDGLSQEKANAVLKDMRHLHDRVAGTVLREPDTMNQKGAEILRTLAQLNYLGSAGISTITEPARIMMEHGIGPTMKGLFSFMKDNQLRMGAKELRIAGEALEILHGSAHLRLVDDLNNNPLRTNLMDRSKNVFYLLNGLAPITRLFKDFDGMMRSHSIIDYSVRWTKGQATKQEQEWLLRYGIDLDEATRIANAPHQKSGSGLYLANTEAWKDTIEFPATKANIIVGNTNSFAPSGRYKPAFYRDSEKTIYIDEDYIRDTMYAEQGWKNPRMEGVKPIPDGIINSPDDYVTFIKMHEIMHTIHRPKDVGITDMRKKENKAAYENAINDLAISEIKKQKRVNPETVRKFRVAMSSGASNTILMGTPADKPIVTDGVAYLPMRVAKTLGMKEDAKYKGYARVETPLLALPFQFYSYAFAALNKTTAAYAHGQLKNKFFGTAIAMGLGYMVLDAKTPDFVDLSFQDKFTRSFDYSGVAALYSDMFYTGMQTTMASGGPNLTGGFLQPRFPQDKNYLDAVTGLAGAGPSIASDYGRGMYDMLTGNVGEGSKEFIRALPFARILWWKGLVNDYTRMLEGAIDDQQTGFGRF